MEPNLHCPYCEALLDEAALLTNVCSACRAVLGDVDQTIRTIRLESALAPLSESEVRRPAGGTTNQTADFGASGSIWQTAVTESSGFARGKCAAAAPAVNANPRLFTITENGQARAGEASPDYTLFAKIGEGGMGKVIEARQQALGRNVAVKVLNAANLLNAANAEKFKAEAAITGNLEHPNIVPIYDLGQNAEGEPFYAMKRVNGKPWNRELEGKSLQENIEVLLKVCDAVAFAHSRGVIHRDLKPENVMLGEFGEVLLMDWGLAAGIWDESKAPAVTYADAIAGTPAYMAPEMAQGLEDEIGPLSDVYLLGAILYEIITGKPPHGGRNVRECLSNASENRIEEPWITSELLKTAMKAMATHQMDRYSSVREFQCAIREHYRSVEAATRARRHLAKAQKSREYRDFFRAVFGFAEALEIWDGNESAAAERENALKELAGLALDNGDTYLAASLIADLRADDEALRARLAAAIQK